MRRHLGVSLLSAIAAIACSDDGTGPDTGPAPSECVPLTLLEPTWWEPLGLNDAGLMVGEARRAVLWTNGIMTELGTLGGIQSQATAVNEAASVSSGLAVGASRSTTAGDTSFALLWDLNCPPE